MSAQWAALAGGESQEDLLAISRPRSSQRSAKNAGIFQRAWTLLVSVYTTLNFDNPHTELHFREQYAPPPAGRSVDHHRGPRSRGGRSLAMISSVPLRARHGY